MALARRPRLAEARGVPTLFRSCALCEAGCGLAFEVEGGRLRSVRPDPDDPISRGFACPKGIAYPELEHDPDRLRAPQRRRPDGRFEPASWEEALAASAAGLARVREEHGADAVAAYFGNPIVHDSAALLVRGGLLAALGTRNRYSAGSQDTSPRFATSYLLYGASFAIPIPDVDRTQHLLCLGANPLVSNGSFLTAPDLRGKLRALRARGGRLVVVDPRRSETAREADEHVAILPGGDAALLLGMARVLLDEGRVDRARLEAFARGFPAVEARLRRLEPGALAQRCGLEPARIARLARDFAGAESSVAYSRVGVCNNRFGTLATFATDLVNLLAGRLGAAGGALFARPALDITRVTRLPGMDGYGRFRSRVRGLPETLGDLPTACLAEEIETPGPGRVRALFCFAGNPVLSAPNGRRLDAALAGLDFMVAVDYYPNETTRHADWILPPAGPLSDEQLDIVFPAVALRAGARCSPAVVPRAAHERHDWEILLALAERLGGGLTGLRPVDALLRAARRAGLRVTPNQLLDAVLRTGRHGDRFLPFSRGLSAAALRRAPHGVDLGPLEPGFRERVFHRDGRIRLDAPALLAGFDAFLEERESARPGAPEGAGLPLLLIGRRDPRSNNSWMHNLPSLVAGRERCTLLVHPEDARRAGLGDGDTAWLESRVHGALVPLRVSDEMRPGVVSLPHGWGHRAPFQRTAAAHAGVSFNDFSDDAEVEAVVGQSILNGVPVRLGPPRA